MYEIILTFWDYDDAALIENEYYFADTEEDAIDILTLPRLKPWDS